MAAIQPKVSESALRFARVAADAGVPREAVQRFLSAGYIAQPKQLQFHAAARSCDLEDGPTQVGFGGARGPGKSHALFAQAALDDCQRVPGLKVLFLRKIVKNAREQFEDLRRVVLRYVEHNINRSSGMVSFPNGSRIILGHFRTEGDIDQYLGIEYDLIVIEEATTLTLSKYRTLRDSNRTSKDNWRPRIYSSTNPGGVGHAWYKELFIVPARRGDEGDTRFVFGTVDDNVFVDKGYTKKLEENTGWKLRAYRFGDWDIAAGQFFTNWQYDRIVCEPFEIPRHWPGWSSLDYGFTHPTVAYLFTEFDGEIIVVAEHYGAKMLPATHSVRIKSMLARQGFSLKRLKGFPAGDDVFANKGDEEGKTIADQYKKYGIVFDRTNTDRIDGASTILTLLGDAGDPAKGIEPIEPRLKIFNTCVKLIECLPSLQHDPHRPEDVLKVDVDEEGNGGDDPYDGFRYGVMFKRTVKSVVARAGGKRPQLPGQRIA